MGSPGIDGAIVNMQIRSSCAEGRDALMKSELTDFDISPVVVPAGVSAEIVIRPLFDSCRFDSHRSYRIAYSPISGPSSRGCDAMLTTDRIRIKDGTMRIAERFQGEQEHILLLETASAEGWELIGDFRIYSLERDLFERRPFKGDLHIHSCRSDGEESPAYVAGACRRIGFDFMAVTDHRKYQPSIEAQLAFEKIPIDLRIFRGEEIHPPGNPVHIVSFGGESSVNELFSGDAYNNEVNEIGETLDHIDQEDDRYQLASCLWCFRKIRELGGLGIFCHPYWIVRNRFDVSSTVTDLLIDYQPFDALELLGGYYPFEAESNLLQVARYHEERAKGKRVPIVGVSDAHGCECGELFGWFYTIAFSKSFDLEGLTEAIKGLYSVAVEAIPGSIVRAHGPSRLVAYSQFLLREVFPRHDALCREEGALMLAHLTGNPEAAHRLSLLKGRTGALMNHLWSITDST